MLSSEAMIKEAKGDHSMTRNNLTFFTDPHFITRYSITLYFTFACLSLTASNTDIIIIITQFVFFLSNTTSETHLVHNRDYLSYEGCSRYHLVLSLCTIFDYYYQQLGASQIVSHNHFPFSLICQIAHLCSCLFAERSPPFWSI